MTGYSQIDNSILLNKNLSLEAKGLYSIIKHFSTIPNFKIKRSHILSISGYGEKAFRRVWKELKTFGLLVESKVRQGSKWIYSFTLGTLKDIVADIKEGVKKAVNMVKNDTSKAKNENTELIEGKTGLTLSKWQSYVAGTMDNAFLVQALGKFNKSKGKKFTFLIDCYLDILAKNRISITQDILKLFKKENTMLPIIFDDDEPVTDLSLEEQLNKYNMDGDYYENRF
ncbi:MAG: hypothetical protein RR620_12060 [Clostridium sp.]